MPALFHYFSEDLGYVNWQTVVIYTCKDDCTTEGYVEEFCRIDFSTSAEERDLKDDGEGMKYVKEKKKPAPKKEEKEEAKISEETEAEVAKALDDLEF